MTADTPRFLRNFSFVEPGVLAGCAHPMHGGDLRGALGELERQGVRAVVSLDEDGLPAQVLAEANVAYRHIPINDFEPPSIAQVQSFVEFVNAQQQLGHATVAHCYAGVGRTGTMLACYLVSQGADPKAAIRAVRHLRPGSIETDEQEQLVAEYAESLGD